MKYTLALLFGVCLTFPAFGQFQEALITVPEKTSYAKTSSSDEVLAFVNYVAKNSPWVHTETLLESKDGNQVPMMVLARPKVRTPSEAQASGKLIVYMQGNIHGGEVEGKEALMILARDILFGEKKHLLDNQILIFVPNYNSDGNDKFGPDNRRSQDGSPVLTGERRSGEDYDLNRDGMKMEARETRALFQKVINTWDPAVFVDLHTTNGTWHGNSLTYAHSYHHAGHPATSNYTRDVMLPAIKKKVLDNYGLHFDIYGSYYLRQGWPPKNLYTYNHHPRYLVNQFGLRNRISILSETFAHLKFYDRIHAAHTFATEILAFTNSHAAQIQTINSQSLEETLQGIKQNAGSFRNGVRFKMVPEKKPFTLRTYDHVPYIKEGGDTSYVRSPYIIEVPRVNNYSAFEATVEATVPKGYLIPPQFTKIIDKLINHGIKLDTLPKRQSFSGEVFEIQSYEVAKRSFEHHHMATAKGTFKAVKRRFPKGTIRVSMDQPLANLIFYLLEPQSDDGLVTWNFFDAYWEENQQEGEAVEYPVFKYWDK